MALPLRRRAAALLVVLVPLGGATLAGCSSSSSSAASAAATSASATIRIKNFAYNELTVHPGATVTVRNDDQAPHSVTAVDGSFTTEVIKPGGTGSFTAPAKPGVYAYYCTVHDYMKMDLVVR